MRRLRPSPRIALFGSLSLALVSVLALGGCGPQPPTQSDPSALGGEADTAPGDVSEGEADFTPETKDPAPTPTPAACTKKTDGGTTSCKDEATWTGYGKTYCASIGKTVKGVTFANSCGRGQWRLATYECCDAAPPPRCISEVRTDTRTCRSADDWKREGTAFCAGKMLPLTNLTLTSTCGTMGRVGYHQAKFECCVPTPPPPPPPPGCVTEAQRSMTCKDAAVWKMDAEVLCRSKMKVVSAVSLGGACVAGGFTEAKIECCDVPTPPPPPPGCFTDTQRAMTCKAADAWKRDATALCASKMKVLSSLTLGSTCPMGGAMEARIECCDPTPPPPPPACTTEAQRSMTCKDASAWKTDADAACKSKMKTLTSLSLGGACMAGGYTEAKFECCDTPPPPPPPPGCFSDAQRSTTCKTADAWKMDATAICASKMKVLSSITLGATCPMGGAMEARFECCDTTPPPPLPPLCTLDTEISRTCKDAAAWKTDADALCKSKMKVLTNVSLEGACMAGGYTTAKIECCDAPTPPTPACTAEAQRSMTCKDASAWKTDADAACKSKMKSLTSLSLGGACMAGGYTEAKFECCDTTPTPPTPGACMPQALGDGRSCYDEAKLKSDADTLCMRLGLRTDHLSFADACGPTGPMGPTPGQWRWLKFDCCK